MIFQIDLILPMIRFSFSNWSLSISHEFFYVEKMILRVLNLYTISINVEKENQPDKKNSKHHTALGRQTLSTF